MAFIEVLFITVLIGFLLQAFRKAGTKIFNKWTLYATIGILVISAAFIIIGLLYKPWSGVLTIEGIRTLFFSMGIIWAMFFCVINRVALVTRLTEGRALIELGLLLFLLIYAIAITRTGNFFFFSIPGIVVFGLILFHIGTILRVSFSSFRPGIWTMAWLFFWHLVVELICAIIIIYPYLNPNAAIGIYETIINGLFIGFMGVSILANGAVALSLFPEKHEPTWRYAQRINNYFSGNEKLYIDKDISKMVAALTIIIFAAFFTIMLATNIIGVTWVIIITLFAAEIMQNLNMKASEPKYVPPAPDYSEIKQV